MLSSVCHKVSVKFPTMKHYIELDISPIELQNRNLHQYYQNP